MTGAVTREILRDDQQLSLCPAIFQERTAGTSHLRVCCFGDRALAALLTSDRLDWRYPLDAKARPVDVDRPLAAQLGAVLDELRLRMGISTSSSPMKGEVVRLEVKPQGQFLFLTGMCGLPLAGVFADFLCDELEGSSAPSMRSVRQSAPK
jgi:hypothetical protein